MIMEQKKLLIIAYDYFPIENANTIIIRNLCQVLSKDYAMDIVVHTTEEKEDNKHLTPGTRIIRIPTYPLLSRKSIQTMPLFCYINMMFKKILGKINHDEREIADAYRFYKCVCKKINCSQYDAIISFSSPFLSHCCASEIVKKGSIPWMAVYFDPFFSNSTLNKKYASKRKRQEEEVISQAEKVLMTFPTNEDYIKRGIAFAKKIRRMEMPGIHQRVEENDKIIKHERCKCCYFGSLYYDIRNPQKEIRIFSALHQSGIDMTFVGGLYGGRKEDFFSNDAQVEYLGQISNEETIQKYRETDILINIGNTVTNQMPSKIFEYISTGKPIINFYKSKECPTLEYMKRYPLAMNIFEEDIDECFEKIVASVLSFCEESKDKKVPYKRIKEIYEQNCDDSVAQTMSLSIAEMTGMAADRR